MRGLFMAVTGFAAGVLAGMGMGGGTVLIPVLTLLLGVEQRGAQGVNMLSFLPGAALALYVHRKEGRLDVRKSLPVTLFGALGAAAGALLAAWIEGRWLRKCFGAFLIALAALQLKEWLSNRKN